MPTEIKSVDISRSCKIDGWMQESELFWLAEKAMEHKLIVELGSYLGRSTRSLADHTPGQVIAIDDWNGCKDVEMSEGERRGLFPLFNVNLADHLLVRKVKAYRIDHMNVDQNRELSLLRPDMVFVDGDHTYTAVKHDIDYWFPKLVSGGLMCGHDSFHPPIAQAVKESFSNVEFASSTTIWWTIKP